MIRANEAEDGPLGSTKNSAHRGLAFTGAGFSFCAIVGVMTWLGSWADGKFGTDPWLLISGSLLGVAIAVYDLIRTVNAFEESKDT